MPSIHNIIIHRTNPSRASDAGNLTHAANSHTTTRERKSSPYQSSPLWLQTAELNPAAHKPCCSVAALHTCKRNPGITCMFHMHPSTTIKSAQLCLMQKEFVPRGNRCIQGTTHTRQRFCTTTTTQNCQLTCHIIPSRLGAWTALQQKQG
jgi:hypothetical protein